MAPPGSEAKQRQVALFRPTAWPQSLSLTNNSPTRVTPRNMFGKKTTFGQKSPQKVSFGKLGNRSAARLDLTIEGGGGDDEPNPLVQGGEHLGHGMPS